VKIPRRFFHRPHKHAKMASSLTANGGLRYRSTRLDDETDGVPCTFEHAPGADVPLAAYGSLEFFLVERYRLYSLAPSGLRRGAVFHQPYPLCQAEVSVWDEQVLSLDGFDATRRPPDHSIMSPGVDVTIFPLERV
jgi:uncharacterized protein YqjF (DUF2071 family)